jgi:transposase InsO family protein
MYELILAEQDGLPIQTLCALAQVSRSGFYRFVGAPAPVADREEMRLRDQVQRLCLEMPGYGYRRVTVALQRQGWSVNHKRVLRLMGEDNLLCVPRQAWMRTTDSAHQEPIYPNLAAGYRPEGPNQLWVADITYIRLWYEFIYLAVLLDVWSRRAIGWALSRHIDTQLTLTALEMALRQRTRTPGLIHHSDQGVQYAAQEYIQLLKKHQLTISMSRKGSPYDNAFAESFIKTLKHEEVLLNEYETLEEAYGQIDHFIEQVYNRKRLHSALGYRPPVEFEQLWGSEIIPETGITLIPSHTVSI